MPSNDRVGQNRCQHRAPVAPEAGPPDPQKVVAYGQPRPFSGGPLQHTDLVTQSQVLQLTGSA